MRKYILFKVFVTLFQQSALRKLAHEMEVSVSSLVRSALTQYITALEEFNDSQYYPSVAPTDCSPITAIDPRV